MREELLRRGGLPPRPGMPGISPHDPMYLEASRRYAAQAQAAAGLPSPYGSRECQCQMMILFSFISFLSW